MSGGGTDISATLAERGNRYGLFTGHARITQGIKRAMIDSPNWAFIADDQREALEMLAHKIGRILNGDPDYHDSWHDIIGYTKLVADRLVEPPMDGEGTRRGFGEGEVTERGDESLSTQLETNQHSHSALHSYSARLLVGGEEKYNG